MKAAMAIKKFDPETLKKLQSDPPAADRHPENGATTPSADKLREAVREANDPKRLVSLTPGYYCPSR